MELDESNVMRRDEYIEKQRRGHLFPSHEHREVHIPRCHDFPPQACDEQEVEEAQRKDKTKLYIKIAAAIISIIVLILILYFALKPSAETKEAEKRAEAIAHYCNAATPFKFKIHRIECPNQYSRTSGWEYAGSSDNAKATVRLEGVERVRTAKGKKNGGPNGDPSNKRRSFYFNEAEDQATKSSKTDEDEGKVWPDVQVFASYTSYLAITVQHLGGKRFLHAWDAAWGKSTTVEKCEWDAQALCELTDTQFLRPAHGWCRPNQPQRNQPCAHGEQNCCTFTYTMIPARANRGPAVSPAPATD